jgi:hypothetical protein
VITLLRTIASMPEDEFEHTPKTIVAGVVSYIMGLHVKNKMKPVSDASGVSALSIHKIVSKLKTMQ